MTSRNVSVADPRKPICCEASDATSTYSRCSSRPSRWCPQNFLEEPEVTKRDVNFLCLVWFMWNTWINCKRNESPWINCREPEWVFYGIFQALCGVPSGCMATSCKFKSTSWRCSKRSSSWTSVSWHVSSHVAVDKCWQSLGLYSWFSIAARCTP